MTERRFVPVPKHWPDRHNAHHEPCDMMFGPCACGAWHRQDESWVLEFIAQYGVTDPRAITGTLIECDGLCGGTVDAVTSKKIWISRGGDDYQADLCDPCFERTEAELRAVGLGLTPQIQPARDFADPDIGAAD